MGRSRVCIVLLIAFSLMAPLTGSMADDHAKNGKHFQSSSDREFKGSKSHGRGDHGNETTGQLATWLLVAANLTVVTSVSIKAAHRFLPLAEGTKKSLIQINQIQKKYLLRFHYILNPGILAIAILHWSLSRCSSTSLPEWGLIAMLILAGIGLVLKLRLAPPKFNKFIYKVHSHPGVIGSVALVVLAGHLMVD